MLLQRLFTHQPNPSHTMALALIMMETMSQLTSTMEMVQSPDLEALLAAQHDRENADHSAHQLSTATTITLSTSLGMRMLRTAEHTLRTHSSPSITQPTLDNHQQAISSTTPSDTLPVPTYQMEDLALAYMMCMQMEPTLNATQATSLVLFTLGKVRQDTPSMECQTPAPTASTSHAESNEDCEHIASRSAFCNSQLIMTLRTNFKPKWLLLTVQYICM